MIGRYDLDIISVSTPDGYDLVPLNKILFLEAQGRYTIIHLLDNVNILSSKNLGFYESKLNKGYFLRIHHSIIINLSKVKRYLRTEGGQIILSNDKRLQVSRTRKTFMLKALKHLC